MSCLVEGIILVIAEVFGVHAHASYELIFHSTIFNLYVIVLSSILYMNDVRGEDIER